MDEKKYINVAVPLRLDWEPTYMLHPGQSVRRGDRVNISFAGRSYLGVVTNADAAAPRNGVSVKYASVADDFPPITDNELKLWQFITDYYLCTIGEVYKMACPAGMIQKDLKAKTDKIKESIDAKLALAEKTRDGTKKKAAIMKSVLDLLSKLEEMEGMLTWEPVPTNLSKAQAEACNQIKSAFIDRKPALLDGVTGSGKTEVYISLASQTLAQGKNVLVLVPEIALSSQLEERLRAYFGSALLVYNSGETMFRRGIVAERVRNKPYVVLGTRSAIFLPHKDLGLVVVDEEHDGAYKQDSTPRYNGRDCAAVLARFHGANLLLGSATPSMESIYNCEAGKYQRVFLQERYYGSEDAKVLIVDTTAEYKKNGMVGSFSRKLTAEMQKVLSRGEQVLILRARRAYSTSVQCKECGEIVKCPHCNVPMSYHKDSDKLVCHYCGKRLPAQPCPNCGGELQGMGSGTQKIEEETAKLFPSAKVARLDSDTSITSRQQITSDFAEGKIDILIGTQMLTKGFDFPGLSLVAAIGADGLLGQLDFRADEKAVQLLSQLRGRAGRRDSRGTLVIQTSKSDHPVYQLLGSSLNADAFESALLVQRKEFGYPPYTRLMDVILQDTFESRIEVIGKMLAAKLGAISGISIIGPFPPQIDKIADRYIRIIRLTLPRTTQARQLKDSIRKTICAFESDRKYTGHISLDVDPQ